MEREKQGRREGEGGKKERGAGGTGQWELHTPLVPHSSLHKDYSQQSKIQLNGRLDGMNCTLNTNFINTQELN